MKFFTFFLIMFHCTLTLAIAPSDSDVQQCNTYVSIGENYKIAHKNEYCIRAAISGAGSAQYSVGMAYGFSGDPASEEYYYRLAANNRTIAAYLALGHILYETRPWESIYWYQRYIYIKTDHFGYAALKVSRIFKRLGESEQAAYWLEACQSSTYQGCSQ